MRQPRRRPVRSNLPRVCRIARGVQRGRMLPSLRLLIAATLATIVVLIGGFGIFAALRVSRDPIAHLPTAAVPLQQVADAGTVSALGRERPRSREQRSQFDVAMTCRNEPWPGTPTVGQRDDADLPAKTAGAASRATEARASSADRDPKMHPSHPSHRHSPLRRPVLSRNRHRYRKATVGVATSCRTPRPASRCRDRRAGGRVFFRRHRSGDLNGDNPTAPTGM